MIKSLLILSFAILIIQSCSFHWTRIEATNGKKFWVRAYKDFNKQEEFEDRYIFKNWERTQTYEKYTGNITSDTTHCSTYIQFDSVRIYLFHGTDRYKSLFTSGLISGQLLYCKMDSSCKPTEGFLKYYDETGEPIIEDLWGWTGHTITIDYFEELRNIKSKPTVRKFKFWVYPFKHRFNGCNDVFLLELTNNNASEQTDLETFIKGASVTFLALARVMI